MRRIIAILMIAFLLPCCEEDEKSKKTAKSPEEIRIEKEVTRRVEVVKNEIKFVERGNRLKTIRVLGFIMLTGGAACGLIWLQHHRHAYIPEQSQERQLQMPSWRDHYPVSTTRVMELPASAPPAERIETPVPPRRRREPRQSNNNRRNHDDETPRYR